MCIFEYDEEAEIAKIKKMEREDEREIWQREIEDEREFWQREVEKIKKMEREDEREIWKREMEKQRVLGLIDKVCKKMEKDKSLEQMANELEEEIKVLQPIYEMVKAAGDNLDCDLIYEELQNVK